MTMMVIPVLPEEWLKATEFGDLPTLACQDYHGDEDQDYDEDQEDGDDEDQDDGDDEDGGETKSPPVPSLFIPHSKAGLVC